MSDLSDNLKEDAPLKRVETHVNTLDQYPRYCFNKEELSTEVRAKPIQHEELLYQTDEYPAALDGDICSTNSGTVENAAAFLEEELEESTDIWIYKLEVSEERYGFTAAYTDSQNIYEKFLNRAATPTSILHVFEPVEDSEQVDIYLERADENSVLQS